MKTKRPRSKGIKECSSSDIKVKVYVANGKQKPKTDLYRRRVYY